MSQDTRSLRSAISATTLAAVLLLGLPATAEERPAAAPAPAAQEAPAAVKPAAAPVVAAAAAKPAVAATK